MTAYFPLLKPADWEHRELVPHWRTGPAGSKAPIVAMAEDIGDGYAITGFDPEKDDTEQLWAAMAANLDGLRYEWSVSELATIRLMTCSGNDFAAEMVLDIASMRLAHEHLASDRLLVSVPRRTCIYVVPYHLDPAQALVFSHVVRTTYNDDSYGNAPITPGVYIVEGGRISGFIDEAEMLAPAS
ncbi:hypothetical protein [Nocardia sp. NPDC052566]|uniref:hypothetical protein n=1 Tax=Nocardia sp. NPDC052566 TaxID=3364330 RepID=UPI0037C9728B